MPGITSKIIKSIPHYTVRPLANKGTHKVTFKAVESDNQRPVVLHFIETQSDQHARDIADRLGWIIV